jgi:hypothetical protein
MPDRRQVLRALLLAGAGLAVPAACGVPAGGGPVVDGPGPTYDPIAGNQAPVPQPDPSQATTAVRLVELFLAAVSGPLDTADLLGAAQKRAKSFLTPTAQALWTPAEQVTVVRVADLTSSISGSNTVVTGTIQAVGKFEGDRGLVSPPNTSTTPTQARFVVSPAADGSGLRISELSGLPVGFPLSTAALDNWYFTPQLLYFWDSARRWLVPDLRYVPKTSLADTARLAAIVKWLIQGPSDLITSLTSQNLFPSNTALDVPNVEIKGDAVTVNFSAAFQGVQRGDLDKLLAQVRWSLQPQHQLTAGPVELRVSGRRQETSDSNLYKRVNQADDVTRDPDPQAFLVVGSTVQALEGSPPPVLNQPEYNKNVQWAALSRNGDAAALVTTGKQLLVGRADNGIVSYQPVKLTGNEWSRPAWLPSKRLLLVVDGVLLAVSGPGATPAPVLTDVSAFAIAPDGYRLAVIRRGALLVCPLRDDGDQPSVNTGSARQLDAGLADLTGVAWSRLDRLVVAGREGTQYRLAEVTIDGAISTVWANTNFRDPINSVCAYAKLPSQPPGPGAVLVQAKDTSYRVFASSSSPVPLTPREPSPGPSGTKSTAKPTAPFYPD